VVSDAWDSSDPDTVTVSFENIKPVADAGNNQSVLRGATVSLDGSGSSDTNNDPLTCIWNIVSKPVGSLASLSNPASFQTSFIADLAGEYVLSLVVDDGFENSEPCNVTVLAITSQDACTQTLQETTATTNGFEPEVFKNEKMQNTTTNKINAALAKVDQGNVQEALDKLIHDVLAKTDGCAVTGSPDKNDWIEDCDAQAEVYPLIMEAIEYLQNMQ
jgi:hypothetical protein